MSYAFELDHSGLNRPAKKAALYALQDSQCAVCPARERTGPGRRRLVADHDHETGLLRGLLCQSCNIRATAPAYHRDIVAYFAYPPAGWDWMWDVPDIWGPACIAAVRKLDCTVLEYVRSSYYADYVRARIDAQEAAVRRALQVALPPLG